MVNLASRFMAATKQFGVYLNISHFFYAYLTKRMKGYLRLIDKVTVKGSSIPIKIYCFDFNTAGLGGGGSYYDANYDEYESKKNRKETCKNSIFYTFCDYVTFILTTFFDDYFFCKYFYCFCLFLDHFCLCF